MARWRGDAWTQDDQGGRAVGGVVGMACLTLGLMAAPAGALPSGPVVPAGAEAGATFLGASCPTAELCVAVGAIGPSIGLTARSVDGGRTFTRVPVPLGTPVLLSVDCNDATHCVAVGETNTTPASALVSDNGGTSWTLVTTPVNSLSGVSCESDEVCAAVGQRSNQAAYIYSLDGGMTWADSTGFPFRSLRRPSPADRHIASPAVAIWPGVRTAVPSGTRWASTVVFKAF
jgi:hypothetical protein